MIWEDMLREIDFDLWVDTYLQEIRQELQDRGWEETQQLLIGALGGLPEYLKWYQESEDVPHLKDFEEALMDHLGLMGLAGLLEIEIL